MGFSICVYLYAKRKLRKGLPATQNKREGVLKVHSCLCAASPAHGGGASGYHWLSQTSPLVEHRQLTSAAFAFACVSYCFHRVCVLVCVCNAVGCARCVAFVCCHLLPYQHAQFFVITFVFYWLITGGFYAFGFW